MGAYIVRRLLLIIPTLFAIMVVNFVVIQVAPGGPVEQAIAQLTGEGSAITDRITRGGGENMAKENNVPFLGRIPIDPDLATACDTGRPFIYHSQHKPAAQAFSKAVEELMEQIKKS